MKKNLLIIGTLTVVAITASAFIIKQHTGMAGKTGSGGEVTCASCHTPGSAVATVSISGTPAFISNQYVPGQTYTVNVQVASPSLSAFGFGCEILNGTSAGATSIGLMSAIAPLSHILPSGTRDNATHVNTTFGIGNTKTFTFKWVAPSTGSAYIYAAGLAANNNGSDGAGDAVATASLVLTASPVGLVNIETNVASLTVFPNPSEDNLSLQYSLVNDGNVKASLYNLQGKEICVLFNADQSAGLHTKTILYPNDVASGVYLVKLSSNGKDLVEKMIIKK
jgi:hypothetical protein